MELLTYIWPAIAVGVFFYLLYVFSTKQQEKGASILPPIEKPKMVTGASGQRSAMKRIAAISLSFGRMSAGALPR